MANDKSADGGEGGGGAIAAMRSLTAHFFGVGAKGPTGPGDAGLERAYQGASRIGALLEERNRLRELADAEVRRIDELTANLEQLNARRIEGLTEHRVSDNLESKAQADSLSAECAKVRQEIEDASAVAEGIEARARALAHEIEPLKMQYRRDLGEFLGRVYAGYMEEYNRRAPELADLIYKVAATRRVMMRYMAGNSNGWDGAALLPAMRAGEGRHLPPLLDAGSREFDGEATARMEEVLEKLKSAGFLWRTILD